MQLLHGVLEIQWLYLRIVRNLYPTSVFHTRAAAIQTKREILQRLLSDIEVKKSPGKRADRIESTSYAQGGGRKAGMSLGSGW